MSQDNTSFARAMLYLRTKGAELFDLERDKSNEHYTIELIKDDVDFRGAKIWILIFAIFIASLGLNVNSTAVIIGAMLISPLMGPIVGFGLGLGIMDLTLIKRALRNLGVMTLISLATATLYFLISPLSQAQSELLARTQPTIYDVLIATIGGAAGCLASGTKNKGNVIPGVAIATALMPPLCTAGYGLSQGNMSYFFGAGYLYLINSVYIGLATFVMVRILRFPRKQLVDKVRELRIRRWIIFIALAVSLPSIYSGVRLIEKTIIEENAHRFVEDQLNTAVNQVVRQDLSFPSGNGRLEVVLLGQELDTEYIDSIRTLMQGYGLGDVELVVRQGFNGKASDAIDVDLLRGTVMKDLYDRSDETIRAQARTIDSLTRRLQSYDELATLGTKTSSEAQVIFPTLRGLVLSQAKLDTTAQYICLYRAERRLSRQDEERLRQWLSVRLSSDNVLPIYQP